MKWLKLILLLGGYFFWAYNPLNGGLYREPDSGGGFATAADCQAVAAAAQKAAAPPTITIPAGSTGSMWGNIAPGRPPNYRPAEPLNGDIMGNSKAAATPTPAVAPIPGATPPTLLILMPQCTFLQDNGS